MYQVSDLCKEALKQYKRDLRFRIYMTDTLIKENDIIEFNITDGIVAGENFELGGAVASTFSAKINNLHGLYENMNFKYKELKAEIGIVLSNGSTEYVPMGIFTVDEYKEENNFINIEALDKMIKFETEYKSNLEYPTTVKAILQEICSICNVELATLSFLNEDYIVEKPIEQDTCRAVLKDIAILAGAWVKINRSGKLVFLTTQETDLEINKDNYIKLDIKEEFFIDNYVVTETYFPVDPILLNLNVAPFATTWQGNLALDVGDKVILNDDKKIVNSIVTKQKIKFNGGLVYETECSGLSEQQQKTQLVNQKKLNRRFASEIKQNADEISTKVTAEEACSAVVQNADRLHISVDGKLSGRDYEFDGEGFTIGGREGNTAKHTPDYSEWIFKNGGKARIDEGGFYFQHGESKNEYHSLIKVYEQQVNTSGIGNTFDFNITLPSEFKGKNFLIIPMITDAVSQENSGKTLYISGRHGAWVKNINRAAGTFNVYGQYIAFKVITTNEFGGIVDLEKMYYGRSKSDPQVLPLKLNISILVIA